MKMYFRSKKKDKDKKMMRTGQIGPRKERDEEAEDGPADYEGKEHVRYKNPGYSKHNIRIPEDEPHMKSRVSKEESHEMEDNYHMDVPDQTEKSIPKKIKRAFMKMDQPDEEGPKPLYGNLVTQVNQKGMKDEDGWEDYSDNEMQEDSEKVSPSKQKRKKIAIAVIRRKMNK